MRAELEQALLKSHEVAQRHRLRREALRQAVERGDTDAVVRCARILLGMEEDEAKSDCAPQGLKRGAGGS